MIKALWKDIFSRHTSFLERFVAGLLVLIVITVVGAVGWLAFYLVDSAGVNATKSAVVSIESRWITPAYATTTFVSAGKVLVPIVTYHPARYNLRVQIGGEPVKFTVGRSFFDQVSPGTRVQVGYGVTRLSRSYRVVTVALAPGPYTSTLPP